MKIVMMGSGGLGGYYGAALSRAGHEVTFIARGSHLAALRSKGIEVKSVHGDFALDSVRATDATAEVGPVDLVVVCVKTPGTEEAARALEPLLGPETTVVSLQNGIDAAERIGGIVGMERLIGGATWISSALEAPGVIRQVSEFRRIVLGELDGRMTPRLEALVRVFRDTGAAVEASDNILKVLWTKFLFIAAISGLGSLTRLSIGEYRGVPEARALLVALMGEVKALAGAHRIVLDEDVIDRTLGLIDGAAPDIKPSMQRDMETGRPCELESMIGVVVRKGREKGVATPTADTVYGALLPVELKVRSGSKQNVTAKEGG